MLTANFLLLCLSKNPQHTKTGSKCLLFTLILVAITDGKGGLGSGLGRLAKVTKTGKVKFIIIMAWWHNKGKRLLDFYFDHMVHFKSILGVIAKLYSIVTHISGDHFNKCEKIPPQTFDLFPHFSINMPCHLQFFVFPRVQNK